MSARRVVHLFATWESNHEIEIPEGYVGDPEDIVDAINGGDFPGWLEFNSSAAELVDWSAKR